MIEKIGMGFIVHELVLKAEKIAKQMSRPPLS